MKRVYDNYYGADPVLRVSSVIIEIIRA